MLTETFGEVLYCSDIGMMKKLPSPEKLKHRVIISTKPPKEYLEDKAANIQKYPSIRKDYDDGPWDDEPIYDTDDHEDDDKVYVTGDKDALTLNIILKNQILLNFINDIFGFLPIRALTSKCPFRVLLILMSLNKRSLHHQNTSILSAYMLGNQKEA